MNIKKFIKKILSVTDVFTSIALITMCIMMVFITIVVITRAVNYPITGNVEIIRLGMLVMIMFGLAYAQKKDSHITINMIIDRLNGRLQLLIRFIGYILTFCVCMIVCWIFINVGIRNMTETVKTTTLLSIPYFPFNFIMVIGFFLWGLEAIKKIFSLFSKVEGESETIENSGKGGQ